jgi:hypothetical protein
MWINVEGMNEYSECMFNGVWYYYLIKALK